MEWACGVMNRKSSPNVVKTVCYLSPSLLAWANSDSGGVSELSIQRIEPLLQILWAQRPSSPFDPSKY
jgi:hypothetical protein